MNIAETFIQPGTFKLQMLDLLSLNCLPPDWINQIEALALKRAIYKTLNGASITSRESQDARPATVGVVTGDAIWEEMRWLYDLYAGPLLEWACRLAPQRLAIAADKTSSVNINVLAGINSRYERHVDTNPVTGLLFASNLSARDGGGLVFDHASGFSDVIYPRCGLFLAFDATATPHYVAPLRKDKQRISIPMNYYVHGAQQFRPKDLNTYLYGQS